MQEEVDDWQDVLEWEPIDSTPDMVLGDPFVEQQQKLREERRKIEEADHKLTEELFSNLTVDKNNILITLKENSNKIMQRIKTSGKHITIRNPNARKSYDEIILNNIDDISIDIEEKYFNNKDNS